MHGLGPYLSHACDFYVVPGDTFLFTLELSSVPVQGEFVTEVPLSGPTVEYSVQDVIIVATQKTAVEQPPVPPHGDTGWSPRIRVEIQVVP